SARNDAVEESGGDGKRLGEDYAGGKSMKLSSGAYMRTAVLALAMALCAGVAQAQSPAAPPPAQSDSSGPARTRQESLGNKWSDEQRVDNCKVPADNRGTKPRADTCPPDLTH